MIKVKVFIEKAENGYSAYMEDAVVDYSCMGEGTTVEEAVNDFKSAYNEMKDFYREQKKFFEEVERFYPTIKDRYKGLGSSPAYASREVIMDPKTRRLLRVSMDNPNVNTIMGNLVGSGKENILARKEMLMDFKVTKDMIDN